MTSNLNYKQVIDSELSTNNFQSKNEAINKYRAIAQEYLNDI